MADNIEHQDKGEPVTNCDRLVAVDNIESLIKVIREIAKKACRTVV